MANPWLKFYTSDWRSDPRLRMCSMEARGLWVEMICLMHEATPYGHLLVNGQRPTDTQLALLVGATPDQVTASLGELEAAGVFSRTREGVVYSRKLSRMAKKAATARNNGRKGGNPSLSKETSNSPSVKGEVKGRDKPQKPEARNQIKKKDTSYPKKKPTRLPADWQLPKDWSEWSEAELGMPPPVVQIEADKFRDYWHSRSKDAAKLDWRATWRNWCRSAKQRDEWRWKKDYPNERGGKVVMRKHYASGLVLPHEFDPAVQTYVLTEEGQRQLEEL